ncbi:ABC transporter permease [Alkalisalibacterium limincola]|uniref:ABC-2 type transporter transmembrane domain-containing protein n=1 Tax=Alkalisalibacterium limincola TaxID=2699169 RepID=A0A5C8KIH1_9GAMM|nr:ABC transporter permease [Alkalisalibacterium limincola]TXK59849.1 hypothetical protein FU658_12965 [Alkalisalibacterium limincola]
MSRDPALQPFGVGRATAHGRFWTELWISVRNPEFWALSSWLDIITRARRSRLGFVWLLAPSVVYVFGLGSFFAAMRGESIQAFAIHVALGAMIFRTLMSAIVASANVYPGNAAFILDGHVRLTDYLLQSLARAFFDMCMYLPVVVVAFAIAPDFHWLGIVLAPLAVVLVYLNALWAAVVLSLVGARFADVGQVLANLSIFVFLLTPIIWTANEAPADSIRGQLMRLNPFYHFVEIFRAPILGQPVEPHSLVYVGVMTVVGFLVAGLLYRRYTRFVPLWI